MADTKRCPDCGEVKPRSAYNKNRSRPDGLKAYCRECSGRQYREWRSDPDNRDKAVAATARWVESNHDYMLSQWRGQNLRANYGITHEDYEAMLVAQGGVCAICGNDDPGGRWRSHFHVDHDHDTGEVRGLTCHSCNVTIIPAAERPDLVAAAQAYLANPPARSVLA